MAGIIMLRPAVSSVAWRKCQEALRAAADAWNERTPARPRFVAGAVGTLNVSRSFSTKMYAGSSEYGYCK